MRKKPVMLCFRQKNLASTRRDVIVICRHHHLQGTGHVRRYTRLSWFVSGLALMLGLAAVPARGAQAAPPARQSRQTVMVPFSGTATVTSTLPDSLIPAKAISALVRSERAETFAVRDATHWRVDVHVTTPIIDSHDETAVADGQHVVVYSTLFNRAFRMPGGVTQSGSLLSLLLQSRGAPLGATTAQYIELAKRNPREKVRFLAPAEVLGRTADVLRISPLVSISRGSCTGPKDCAKKTKGYGSATIWLDHEYGVVLRYEEHGIPKQFGGGQGYRYVVTSIVFGHGPTDADLAAPPPVAIGDLPQNSGAQTGGGGGGPGIAFQAPPGFVVVGNPVTHGPALSLRGSGNGGEWLSGGLSIAEGVFRGGPTQGFVYVKERIRALGLPAALTAERAQAAGSCQVWTGTFSNGLTWLAMMRGKIAILVVADKLTQADLVRYAARGICTAPIASLPSAREVQNTVLDHLETEIDITRQILGWVRAAAPSAADKQTLKAFDVRLESFDRTVFAIRHAGDPQAVYSPPGFPPVQRHAFADTVQGLKGEIPAAKSQLAGAESAVQSPADRQRLVQQGIVFDDLVRAIDAMLPG